MNLSIVYNNVANNSTISASETAGTLVADNLLTDSKSAVWRSTGTSASLTLEWVAPQLVAMAALAYTSLTSTATMQVQCFTNISDSTPVFDTGAQLAAPYQPLGTWAWGTQPLGVNAFSYGGSSYATSWFGVLAITKMIISLIDADSPSGYIECGRMICGNPWTVGVNVDWNPTWTMQDSSKHERNDAGDLLTNVGQRSKKISFSLGNLSPVDRNQMMNILRGNGLPGPLFFSMFPQSADSFQEQQYEAYCKLSTIGGVNYPNIAWYSSSQSVEEI
jgi:hypothetical protein